MKAITLLLIVLASCTTINEDAQLDKSELLKQTEQVWSNPLNVQYRADYHTINLEVEGNGHHFKIVKKVAPIIETEINVIYDFYDSFDEVNTGGIVDHITLAMSAVEDLSFPIQSPTETSMALIYSVTDVNGNTETFWHDTQLTQENVLILNPSRTYWKVDHYVLDNYDNEDYIVVKNYVITSELRPPHSLSEAEKCEEQIGCIWNGYKCKCDE